MGRLAFRGGLCAALVAVALAWAGSAQASNFAGADAWTSIDANGVVKLTARTRWRKASPGTPVGTFPFSGINPNRFGSTSFTCGGVTTTVGLATGLRIMTASTGLMAFSFGTGAFDESLTVVSADQSQPAFDEAVQVLTIPLGTTSAAGQIVSPLNLPRGAYDIAWTDYSRFAGIQNVGDPSDPCDIAAGGFGFQLRVIFDGSANSSPVPAIVPQSVPRGSAYSHNLGAVDPEGDAIDYTVLIGSPFAPSFSPPGLVVSASGQLNIPCESTLDPPWEDNFFGDPADYALKIAITDSRGMSSSQELLLDAVGAAATCSTMVQQGGACSSLSQCAAGLSCVDGVCCDSAGTACATGSDTDCFACSSAAGGTLNGTCTARVANSPCNDGLSCTTNDVCNGYGTCAGASACAAPDECHAAGTCTGSGCSMQPLSAGYCFIAGACVPAGAADPGNLCQTCDPVISTSAYSPSAAVCAADACHSASSCDPTTGSCGVGALQAGFCFIGGICVAAGAPNPLNQCEACVPSRSTSSYSAFHANPPTVTCAREIGVTCAPSSGVACSDANIPVVTADDDCGAPLPVTPDPANPSMCRAGATTLTYFATDDTGLTGSCTTTVTVDVAPPTSISERIITLWPPKHGYLPFNLRTCIGAVADTCNQGLTPESVAASSTVLAYGSDEPQSVAGTGKTNGDLILTAGNVFLVRPERSGTANGRVYSIWFQYLNAEGEATTAVCYIGVPHDQAHPAIDDGVCHGWVAGSPPATALCSAGGAAAP